MTKMFTQLELEKSIGGEDRGRGSGGRHFGGVALGLGDVRCEGVKVPEVEHR